MVRRELNGYITYVGPDYNGPDTALLNPFAATFRGKAVHIYTPFDPNTWKIPANTSEFIGKDVGTAYVWFSPNIYGLFLSNYVKKDEHGSAYFVNFPVLVVDYMTPVSVIYSGQDMPGPRPIDLQLKDWRSGVMWSRRRLSETITVEGCEYAEWAPGDYCLPKEFMYRAGWYWVGYQARLIDLPATLIAGVSDVLVFEYKKPNSVVFKVPGFSSVADYLIKRKLNSDGVAELKQFLSAFGYTIDEDATYVTKSGKPAHGITVEEAGDVYRIYLPVKKVGSLGPEIGIGLAIAIVAVALSFAVTVYYLYRIQSLNTAGYKTYLAALVEAQRNYSRCVSACNAYQDDEMKRKCLAGCQNAYNTTLTEAQKAYKKWSSSSSLGELKDLIKWGVIGVIALEAVRALKE